MSIAIEREPKAGKSADLPKLDVDPEFRDFLPPLTPEEDAALEKSIKELGRATDPISVWGTTNIILDGYNRHEKCKTLKASYTIRRIEGLETRADCFEWIFEKQDARRNWTDKARTLAMGRLYNLKKADAEAAAKQAEAVKAKKAGDKADKKDADSEGGEAADVLDSNGHAAGTAADIVAPERETAEMVAEQFGVGEATVRRAGKVDEFLDLVAENAGDQIRQAIRGQQVSFTGTGIKRFASLPRAKAKTVAAKLLDAVAKGEKPSLSEVLDAVAGPAQAVRGKVSPPSAGEKSKGGRPTKTPWDKLDKSIEQVCRNVDEIARVQGGKTNHSKGLITELAQVKKLVSDWKRANKDK